MDLQGKNIGKMKETKQNKTNNKQTNKQTNKRKTTKTYRLSFFSSS